HKVKGEENSPQLTPFTKRRVTDKASKKVIGENHATDQTSVEVYEVELLLARKGTGYLIEAFEETIDGLPEQPTVPCDPAIADILARVHKKALANLKWLPKNISDFLLIVNEDLGPAISVVNIVDDQGPPVDFVYIAKNLRGEGIPPIDPSLIMGCNCRGSCKLNSKKECSCLLLSCGLMPYDENGLLQLPLNYAIFECNMKCNCPPDCINRVTQRGRTVRLQIFKTLQKGWGVRALEDIPKGRFVVEYVGEIINDEEAERRGRVYDSQGLTYLFDLDYNYGPDEDCPFAIDAFKYGNISHFINHSCDPNIAVYPVFYESTDLNIHNLAFFATRDILQGEELCFDYSGGVNLPDVADPTPPASAVSLDPARLARAERNKKYLCYCGSSKCRKFVHIY
ncbi:hypothetical protein L0F63_007450, partial [Massospora cicadina]